MDLRGVFLDGFEGEAIFFSIVDQPLQLVCRGLLLVGVMHQHHIGFGDIQTFDDAFINTIRVNIVSVCVHRGDIPVQPVAFKIFTGLTCGLCI